MRARLALALLVLAGLAGSGCAIGVPRAVTYLSDTGVTLNADLYSSVEGDTTYRFRYGPTSAYGNQSDPLTVRIADDEAHPVSVPFSGLTPATTYHWQVCAADEQEEPPREVCLRDQTFTTGPSGGHAAIAFSSTRDGNAEIYAMNTDGTNPTRLTSNPAADTEPSWSPDGRRIAFSSNRDGDNEIWVMGAAGGDAVRLTSNALSDTEPAWSPAGDEIAFIRAGSPDRPAPAAFVMNADGSDARPLVDLGSSSQGFAPFWAPDGRGYGISFSFATGGFPPFTVGFIAFDATGREAGSAGDCVRADWHPFARGFVSGCNFGGGSSQVLGPDDTRPLGDGWDPSWSPKGFRIAFELNGDIWTMNADGSNRVNRTNTSATESAPAWSHRP